VIVLVGAFASRRGTADSEGQGRDLWEERVDPVVVVVDGVCEGEGVRRACPTNASSSAFI
jgi:hypothetical protein